MSDVSLPTFTLETSTGTDIYLPLPEWASPRNEITKSIQLFDFWNGERSTVDLGIDTQSFSMGGVICLQDEYIGLCFPICFPICFQGGLNTTLTDITNTMNSGLEVTINELGDCLNGVYVIKNFSFDTIPKVKTCWAWSLDLERVRDLS